MKRTLALTLALLFSLTLLSGCMSEALANILKGDKPTADPVPTKAPAAEVVNPLKEVKGPAEFLPLGVVIDAPSGAENVRYCIIADAIAEVQFTHSGCSFTLRAAKAEGDISGVYLDFVKTEEWPFKDNGLSASVSAAKDGATLACWKMNGISYSLFTPDAPAPAALAAIVGAAAGNELQPPAGAEVPGTDVPGTDVPGGVVTAPTFTGTGEPLLYDPIDFLENMQITYDIDGDTVVETVKLTEYQDSYGMDYTVLEIVDNGESIYFGNGDADMPQYGEVLCLMDVIPGDPYVEIIFSGDMMSSDYITHILRYDGKKITPATMVSPYDGEVYTGIFGHFYGMGEDGSILIDDAVDALGSFWGMRDFVHEGNMRFGYAENSTWTRLGDYSELWDMEYGPALTVKLPLPIYMSGTAPEVLAPGTKILVTETDKESFVNVVLQKGGWGRIDLEWKKGSYKAYIAGLPEDDYFEYLPYAG